MNGNNQSYKSLMDQVEYINSIFNKPAWEWTDEELESVMSWENGKCQHDWEEKFLFTSSYFKCKKCGEEE